MDISFKKLNNSDFNKIWKWCQNKYVYEWFEQRKLSFEEITNKYKNKLRDGKQDLFVIQYDNKDIGLVQIYKYDGDIMINKYNNIFEYDLFIGEEKYLSRGIGKKVVTLINEMIFSKYKADAIILRPFKRNERAVRCYEKCGFKVISEYEGIDTLGNEEVYLVLLCIDF